MRGEAVGRPADGRADLPYSESLFESAKLRGVDPKAYLLTAARAALADRAVVTLPHDLLQ